LAQTSHSRKEEKCGLERRKRERQRKRERASNQPIDVGSIFVPHSFDNSSSNIQNSFFSLSSSSLGHGGKGSCWGRDQESIRGEGTW
jgi:hypothetical protein